MAALRHSLFILLPVAFAGLALLFLTRLGEDPRNLPSVLIGKAIPVFALPAIDGTEAGLSSANLRTAAGQGQPVVVNFFASWCVPCRAEHPLISRIAGDWPVFGINYKDTAADAAAWLDELGDPYRAIGADSEGRTGIDFGVYGMPETFVVDGDGIIRYRLASPLTDSEWQNTLLPLLRALTTENAP